MAQLIVTFGNGERKIYEAPDSIDEQGALQLIAQDMPGAEIASVDKQTAGQFMSDLGQGAKEAALAVPRAGVSAVVGGLKGAGGLLQLPAQFMELWQKAPTTDLNPADEFLGKKDSFLGRDPVRDPRGTSPLTAGAAIGELLEKGGQSLERFGLQSPYGKAVAETVGGGLAGGAKRNFRSLAELAISGGAGEAGAQSMGETGRLVAGILAPAALVGSKAQVFSPNAEKLIKQAFSSTKPEDWEKAKVLRKALEEAQIDSLNSQLFDNAATIDELAAIVATHPSTRPKMMAAVADAPEQARAALDDWVTRNLELSIDSPRKTLANVQQRAEDVIEAKRRKAGEKYAEAVPPNARLAEMPAQEAQELVGRLRKLADDPNGFGQLSAAGKFVRGKADEIERKIAVLGPDGQPVPGSSGLRRGDVDTMLRELNQQAEKEGLKGWQLDRYRDILREATPEFQQARDAYRRIIKTEVQPLEQDLLGAIAQIGGGQRPDKAISAQQAIKIVFPATQSQPQAIEKLARDFGADQVSLLFREHVKEVLEKQAAGGKGSSLRYPHGVVEALIGTKAQRDNIEAALDTVAKANGKDPEALRLGFFKLLRSLESTKNLKLPDTLDRAALQNWAGMNITGLVLAPQSRLARATFEKTAQKTFGQIADLLISPEGLEQLEKIAKAPGQRLGQEFVRAAWAANLPSGETE